MLTKQLLKHFRICGSKELGRNSYTEQPGVGIHSFRHVKTGDYSIARNGWISDYNDPVSFLDMWVTGGGNNDWANRFKTLTGRFAERILSENQSQFVACSGKSPVCLKLNGFSWNVREP